MTIRDLLGNVNAEVPYFRGSTSTTHAIVLRVNAFCPVRHNDSLFPFAHKPNFKSSTPQHLYLSGTISEPKVHLQPRNHFDITMTLLLLGGLRQTSVLNSIPVATGKMSIHQTSDKWRMPSNNVGIAEVSDSPSAFHCHVAY